MRKTGCATLALALLISCSGSDSGTSAPHNVSYVVISPKQVAVAIGAKVQLSASVRDENGDVMSNRSVTWTTANANVAAVDTSGLVTGVAAGTAEIAATTAGVSDRVVVGVMRVLQTFPWLSAGGLKTCRLSPGGPGTCWGVGPLGDGSSSSSTTPVTVHGGVTFSALASGEFTVCGISTASALYCWGDEGGTVPARVTGDPGLVSVTVGDGIGPGHYCGLTTSGGAYCWGSNIDGEVGDGTTGGDATVGGGPFRTTPVAVAGGGTFATLTAGLWHTCGVTTNGAAFCWGDSSGGQLGAGPTVVNSSTPLPVSGGFSFFSLSAGGTETCGVVTGGGAYCWGSNGAGQLGNGSITSSAVPVAVAGGRTFTTISTGAHHACALTADGAAYCWGWNAYGELGVGNNTGPDKCLSQFGACSMKPVAVTGGLKFAAVSAGGETTCGLTLSGATYCWGRNDVGQVGDGTKTNASKPVLVL